MSLVAYGASDDSETSDGDEAEVLQVAKSGDANNHALADDGKISDEEDYIPTVSRSAASSTNETGFQSMPAPSSLSGMCVLDVIIANLAHTKVRNVPHFYLSWRGSLVNWVCKACYLDQVLYVTLTCSPGPLFVGHFRNGTWKLKSKIKLQL